MALESNNIKEKKVIEMLENNKNFQEIAKTVRVSFSFISMVKKKMLGEDTTINKKLSIPSQALRLFSEGNSILEVIIILDRPSSEIRNYYADYLRLKNMTYLVSLLETYPDGSPTITKLVKYITQNPSTKDELLVAIRLVKDLPRLRAIKKQLENNIKVLRQERNYLSEGYSSNGGGIIQYSFHSVTLLVKDDC